LTAEEAEVAKKEAIAARDEINIALKEMDLKIASSKKSAEEAAEITAKEPDTIDEPGMTTAEPVEIPEKCYRVLSGMGNPISRRISIQTAEQTNSRKKKRKRENLIYGNHSFRPSRYYKRSEKNNLFDWVHSFHRYFLRRLPSSGRIN